MIRLRQYKASDAKTIVGWCKTEEDFRKWTSDRYDKFPISSEDMNKKYLENNGDCSEPDNFYPFTAIDNGEIVEIGTHDELLQHDGYYKKLYLAQSS